MGFSLKRTVDLSKYGWDGCSITVTEGSYKETAELIDSTAGDPKDPEKQTIVIDMVKQHFVSGEGLNDKGEIETIKKDDVDALPLTILKACISAINGTEIDPN